MSGTLSLLAIIPARGGSKSLPGKNVRLLAGLPLIGHSIRCAQLTPAITRTIVSTDSEAIASVAEDLGADVPFLRPADLASDSAAMWPVIQHALVETERQSDVLYDAVVLLDPTSPGRIPEDIETAVAELQRDPRADGVIGVSEPEFNPYWHCVVDRDGYMQDLIPGAQSYVRRQDVPPVYRINATLYVWRREHVLGADDWRSGRLRMYVVPDLRAFHIDDAAQFQRAELMLEHGLIQLPWLTE